MGGFARRLRGVEGLQTITYHVRDVGTRGPFGATFGVVNKASGRGVVEAVRAVETHGSGYRVAFKRTYASAA